MKRIDRNALLDCILTSLRHTGGSATKPWVLQRVYEANSEVLSQEHYQQLVNGTVPRWRKEIEWAKQEGVIAGIIKRPNRSGWGIWALASETMPRPPQ